MELQDLPEIITNHKIALSVIGSKDGEKVMPAIEATRWLLRAYDKEEQTIKDLIDYLFSLTDSNFWHRVKQGFIKDEYELAYYKSLTI